jgi:alkanesulfonate monooxygenase SsuD/methylene tetrahydromethanopterin reductase-like flavin-dependent oxidoreductase (luciferase family)
MRLGYFTMPMHPAEKAWSQTLHEDREAILLADRLGFHDAFVGEHLTDRHENITNSMIFLAALIHDTTSIRLGTGTTNLSHQHPALVAVNAAMLDHMSGGRFILGISPGALNSDAELLGILGKDRTQLFAEAIDVILRVWNDEAPLDIKLPDNRFHVSTIETHNEYLGVGEIRGPLQVPRPEIVGTVVAPFSKGVVAMGARDFHPLSANFLLPQWLPSHWENYLEGAASVARTPIPTEWRVARTIFVADNPQVAREYGIESSRSPYRFYYDQLLRKLRAGNRLNLFKRDREESDDSVTTDSVLEDLVICGGPDDVAEQIVELREQSGEFGELVYAGIDWVDPDLGRRSMELMAEKVMPAVNAALGEADV